MTDEVFRDEIKRSKEKVIQISFADSIFWDDIKNNWLSAYSKMLDMPPMSPKVVKSYPNAECINDPGKATHGRKIKSLQKKTKEFRDYIEFTVEGGFRLRVMCRHGSRVTVKLGANFDLEELYAHKLYDVQNDCFLRINPGEQSAVATTSLRLRDGWAFSPKNDDYVKSFILSWHIHFDKAFPVPVTIWDPLVLQMYKKDLKKWSE